MRAMMKPQRKAARLSPKNVESTNPFNQKSDAVEAFAPPSPAKGDRSPKSAADRVLALISLQDFEGCWVPTTEVDEIMGFEIPVNPKTGDQMIWITLVVVCFLEQKMASEEGTWALVVQKARSWLEALELMNLEELEKEAAEFVRKQ